MSYARSVLIFGAGLAAVVLILVAGWLILPLLGVLLAINAAGLRERLVSRFPAVGRLRPLHLGLVVGGGGLLAWGLLNAGLQAAGGPVATKPQPTAASAYTAQSTVTPALVVPTQPIPIITIAATSLPAPTAAPTPEPTALPQAPVPPVSKPEPTAVPKPAPTNTAAPKPVAPTAAPAPAKAPSRGVRPVGRACPSSHPIKGNQGSRSTDEWIYHPQGSQSYNATDPEECFASAADAEAAGYRAPRNR
jgi:outer membrane biosynthesis protein TonB